MKDSAALRGSLLAYLRLDYLSYAWVKDAEYDADKSIWIVADEHRCLRKCDAVIELISP